MQPEQPDQNPVTPDKNGAVFSQQFQNQPVAARVPAGVAPGIFTTGVLVQDGAHEFVLDFLLGLARPPQVAARVVLAPGTMEGLVRTLDENLQKFILAFGPPVPLAPPINPKRPNIQEIYENFKLPEELWSGAYANSVMVGHGPAEFFMDFITSFYPTAAVSCRVYFAAQQAPRMLDTLRLALQQFHRKRSGPQASPPQSQG